MPKVDALPEPCGVDGLGVEIVQITDRSRGQVVDAIKSLAAQYGDSIEVSVSNRKRPLTVFCSPPGVAIQALRHQMRGASTEDYTSID